LFFLNIGSYTINATAVCYVHRDRAGIVTIMSAAGSIALAGAEADAAWIAFSGMADETIPCTPESDPFNAARRPRPTDPTPIHPRGTFILRGPAPEEDR
jgi:hypothetical protein